MMVVHEEAHYVESLKRDVKLHKLDVNIKSQSQNLKIFKII